MLLKYHLRKCFCIAWDKTQSTENATEEGHDAPVPLALMFFTACDKSQSTKVATEGGHVAQAPLAPMFLH